METERRTVTVDQFIKMAAAGKFGEDERVELIDGEIIEMSPVGHRHTTCVNRANCFFTEAFGRKAIVSIQNAIKLDMFNMPQPDVVVLKPKEDFYATGHATAADVLFIVEISDTTMRRDRNLKLPRFAAAGVPEVWIEDLKHDLILVFRDPEGRQYRTHRTFRRGETIAPLAFPNSVFRVDDLIGPAI